MIEKFYGITLSHDSSSKSLYEVRLENNEVVLQKVALEGESSIAVGGTLDLGNHLGIMYEGGMQRYDGWGGHRVDTVNTRYWGGGTTGLVALFIDKEKALNCFRSSDLTRWDKRFIDDSVETMAAIERAEHQKIRLDSNLHRSFQAGTIRKMLESYSGHEILFA